jgi:hypothetical protein
MGLPLFVVPPVMGSGTIKPLFATIPEGAIIEETLSTTRLLNCKNPDVGGTLIAPVDRVFTITAPVPTTATIKNTALFMDLFVLFVL